MLEKNSIQNLEKNLIFPFSFLSLISISIIILFKFRVTLLNFDYTFYIFYFFLIAVFIGALRKFFNKIHSLRWLPAVSRIVFFALLVLFSILNLNILSFPKNSSSILMLALVFSGIVYFYPLLTDCNIHKNSNSTKKNAWYYSLLILSVLVFLSVKFYVILHYNGSYSDEYYHITSGLNYLENGKFAEIYSGSLYSREGYFSILTGYFLSTFGKTVFVAKLLPTVIGIINLGILIFISSKIYKNKYITVLLILIYSFSPWVILNHFYVRFYVFIEFIILLIVALFLLYKENDKKIYVASILALNLFFVIFYRGASSNLINIFSFFLLLFNLLFNNISTIYRQFKKIWHYSLTVIFLMLVLFSYSIGTSFRELIFTPLKYANNNINYYSFFFNLNFIFSFFVFISCIYIYKSKNQTFKILFSSFLGLVLLHLISNPASHTIRTIFYLLPLYFLFSLYIYDLINLSLVNNFKKILLYALFLSATALTIINSYPSDFLKYPYIDGEIMYYDNSIYPIIKERCSKAIIISANRPEILLFNSINTDYYLNTQYTDLDWVNSDPESKYAYFNSETKKFYYTYTKTPVISTINELDIIKNTNDKICLLTGMMPYNWLNLDMRSYILNNFDLEYTSISSTNSGALRLYILNQENLSKKYDS